MSRLLPAAVILAMSGCLNDSPVAPTGNAASLALGVQVAGVTGTGAFVRVIVSYPIVTQETSVPLLVTRIPLVAGVRPVPLLVDLLPCLRDPGHSGGKSCVVQVDAQLVDTGIVLDQQSAGNYLLKPGAEVSAKPLKLVGGTNPPALQVDTAVRVDPQLVVYTVNASDPDGNLKYLDAIYTDSSGAIFEFVQREFVPPIGGYSGPVFAFLNTTSPSFAPQLAVTAYDSKFASASATVSVVSPDPSAPIASNVTTVAHPNGQVDITFDVLDREQDEARVLVLFRDPAVQSVDPNSSELLGTCVANLLPQNGKQTVGCTAPSKSAIAIVIPVDAAKHVGTAARGTVTIP